MEENNRIIEKAKQSLSFVEQLQNQINLCREALSEENTPLVSRVETLEILLWSELKDNAEYAKVIKLLNENFRKKKEDYQKNNSGLPSWKINQVNLNINRNRAKEQFKEIMSTAVVKKYMSIGEQDD